MKTRCIALLVCTVAAAPVLSQRLSAQTARLVNISTNGPVGIDANNLVGGFVIGGAPKTVLIRAIGPGLAAFGVGGTLADPLLTLFDGAGKVIATNDNWNSADAATIGSVGAFPITPGSRDAVIVIALQPGAYTAQISGLGGTPTGTAILEIYDVSGGGQLINIATRLNVAAGPNGAAAGFVVSPGTGTRKLLVRGIGPALAAFGLPGALPDPKIVLMDGNQNALATAVANAGASALTAAMTQAGAFAPTGNDSAMIATLAPGSFTVQLSGNSGTTSGIALIEVYDITNATGSTPVPLASSSAAVPLETAGIRTFSTSLSAPVVWSVVEAGGGSISQAGVYTAPTIPGTYTIKANSQNSSQTGSAAVVIPVGTIPGYDVGVDYHATGSDYLHTAFVTRYNDPVVRQNVRLQLQGIADRGATVISTRFWCVIAPSGESDLGETWRGHFPMSDQEAANLRAYAQDIAAVKGSGGNRLRLDFCLLWLGRADYQTGTPATGLGYFHDTTGADFTSRVELTTDKVLAAVGDVVRPDGKPVVDTIYLDGEVMIGAKANQDWFMTTHYPRFVSKVAAAGFRPSVYFIVSEPQDNILRVPYNDANFPILNNHRSMYWIYRTLKFMADNKLFIPARIDFSCYVQSTGAPYSQILSRILNDADATLPSLGAAKAYGAAESYYFLDGGPRRQLGQAFAMEALTNPRLQRVCFWTTPFNDGTPGVTAAYPFAFEDYLPPQIIK